MKHFLFIALAVASFQVFAQDTKPGMLSVPDSKTTKITPKVSGEKIWYNPSYRSEAAKTGYFNYSQALVEYDGGATTTPRTVTAVLMWPDSSMNVVAKNNAGTADTLYEIYDFHSDANNGAGIYSALAGFVMDPRSVVYGSSGDDSYFRLGRFNPYTIDSVYIPYFYIRNTDPNIVDTLVFQFYNMTTLKYSINQTNNPPDPASFGFATINYDYQTNMGVNAVITVKLPLTTVDSISVSGGKVKGFAINQTFPALRQTVATIAFKPGTTYSKTFPFDTLGGSTFNSTPIVKRHNEFYYTFVYDQTRYFEDVTGVPSTERVYNNGLFAPPFVRYNTSSGSGGWNGLLYPGQAIYTTVQPPPRRTPVFPNMTFVLSSPNVGIANVARDGFNLGDAYPNPTKGSSEMTFDFTVGKTSDVTIDIFNLVGAKVGSIVNGKYNEGTYSVKYDVSNLSSGIYMYTINAGSYSATKKFSVTR